MIDAPGDQGVFTGQIEQLNKPTDADEVAAHRLEEANAVKAAIAIERGTGAERRAEIEGER
ncbi:hypothetical protein AB9E06_29645 [Rhizobium leguminosarum]|uniref:hypothetical protein n=1 Tax=Rhizobium leguminosarum TaxID=384 RepID=UPI003F9BC27B